MEQRHAITEGKTTLGIELGSTRIKAVLIDAQFKPIASGSHEWENRLEDGIWTYHLDDVWAGLRDCYAKLSDDVRNRCGVPLETTGAIGISAMMHGYLAFDRDGRQLVPFRTWRNTMTEQAAADLSRVFKFNIPQRWSIAHLYQAILNGESHVKDINFLTTLAGYVHWKLTGIKAIGPDDASGMFPLDRAVLNYNARMLDEFDALAGPLGFGRKLSDIFPAVVNAGQIAGNLTAEGAALLDPSGRLKAGIPFCPPEGDAGTGMVATNSVAERSGNISAGTSVFAMIVLENDLSKVYPEIDMVTTPAGKPVAMVHCNNCSSDIDAWVRLFSEFAVLAGSEIKKSDLYDALYNKALEGDSGCGGLVSYNYYSGEPITGLDEGRPLFVRMPGSNFSLANFMRSLLFSAMAALKIGMEILTEEEKGRLDSLTGHGGLFKTKGVGQRLMASALEVPVAVMESAGEGGAWGIALLAAFTVWNNGAHNLETFLAEKVFVTNSGIKIAPEPDDTAGFKEFMKQYQAGLVIEKAAVDNLTGK